MKYPDGQFVQVGDLIWWDEGHHVGFVNSVNAPDDITPDSGFIVIGRHPFRPDDCGYSLASTRYQETDFTDEGIGRLSDIESVEFRRAEQIAIETTDTPYVSRYTVTTAVADHGIAAWIFSFDGSCQQIRIASEWPKMRDNI